MSATLQTENDDRRDPYNYYGPLMQPDQFTFKTADNSLYFNPGPLVVRYRLGEWWHVDWYFKPNWRIRITLWLLGFKAEWY